MSAAVIIMMVERGPGALITTLASTSWPFKLRVGRVRTFAGSESQQPEGGRSAACMHGPAASDVTRRGSATGSDVHWQASACPQAARYFMLEDYCSLPVTRRHLVAKLVPVCPSHWATMQAFRISNY